MSDIISNFKRIHLNNNCDLSDASSIASSSSPRSSSPFPNWRINYKPMPEKTQAKGVWDGYQTQDEFVAMHLR